jgi:hypothetical protein
MYFYAIHYPGLISSSSQGMDAKSQKIEFGMAYCRFAPLFPSASPTVLLYSEMSGKARTYSFAYGAAFERNVKHSAVYRPPATLIIRGFSSRLQEINKILMLYTVFYTNRHSIH